MPEPHVAVSIVTPDGMGSRVVRWYPDEAAATAGKPELARADRSRAWIHGEAHPRVRDAAYAAHRELAGDPTADVRHYATHHKSPSGVVRRKGDA